MGACENFEKLIYIATFYIAVTFILANIFT